MFITYVLFSPVSNKIYIGFTTNLPQRICSHNHTGKGFTARYRPWALLYTEVHPTRAEAMKREKQLKGGQGRAWIKQYLVPS